MHFLPALASPPFRIFDELFSPPVIDPPRQWAEKNRVLDRGAIQGPLRHAENPVFAALYDLILDRGIEELVFKKSVQIGYSTWLRGIIGWICHCDPDPILLVLPDETTGRKIMANDVLPLFENTPPLAELLSDISRDKTLTRVKLVNGASLTLGWSGSPASLASDPMRVVVFDETDKYQSYTGRESDPIRLGRSRTATFEGRRLIIAGSTPTIPTGIINELFEACERRMVYHVPCPHCRHYQPLEFGRLKWPAREGRDDAAWALAIEAERAAWFECAACNEPINDSHRRRALRAGKWIETGDTRSTRVGIHLWAAHSMRIPWYRIAAEFIRSKSNVSALHDFSNNWLGEVFHQQIAKPSAAVFVDKQVSAAPPRIVPAWAGALVATVDTQKNHFAWLIRAWGSGLKSQRIDHGIATSFDELRGHLLTAKYPCEDSRPAMSVAVLGIDSGGTSTDDGGSRTWEVYRFSQSDPARIKPLKGRHAFGAIDSPLRTKLITYQPPDHSFRPMQLWLTTYHANHYKDRLAAEMRSDRWLLDSRRDPDYEREMTSEHKIPKKKGGRTYETWEKISEGARNEAWDLETMQFVMADMLHLYAMPQTEVGAPKATQATPRRVEKPTIQRAPFRRGY